MTHPRLQTLFNTPSVEVPPRRAFQLCRALGPVARWWLPRRFLRLAAEHNDSFPLLTSSARPELPREIGSCSIAFVNDGLPLLRSAFLVPLCWQEDCDHSPSLPDELRQLADRVVSQMVCPDWRCRHWGLHPGGPLRDAGFPLADLPFHYSSGWAPLAAGLILAEEELPPDPDVLASGAWGDTGLTNVKHLPAKLRLALRWGAREFFLPAWRRPAAQRWLDRQGPSHLLLGSLYSAPPAQPRSALGDFLVRLGARPAPPRLDDPDALEQDLERCVRYYLLLPRGPQAQDFYLSHLLPALALRCRKHVPTACRPTHLVTVASDSPELVALAARFLGVERVVALHTPDYRGKADAAADYLTRRDGDNRPLTRATGAPPKSISHNEAMPGDIHRHLLECLVGVDPAGVVFDLTPGSRLISMTLEKIARRHYPDAWLLYVQHTTPNGRIRPGAEMPMLWRAGEDGPWPGATPAVEPLMSSATV
jgi:hypothetical protein